MIKIKVKRGNKTSGILTISSGLPLYCRDGSDSYYVYGTTRNKSKPTNNTVKSYIADSDSESNFFILDDYGIDLNQDYKQFYSKLVAGSAYLGSYIGYVTKWSAGLSFSLSASGTKKYLFNFFNNTIDSFKVKVDGKEIDTDNSKSNYYVFANDVLSVYTGSSVSATVTVSDFKMIKRSGVAGYICLNSVSFGYTTIVNEVKSTELHEEINLLSEDLACNTFNFSAKLDKLNEINKDDKVYVYNNGVDFGSFYVDEIERSAESIYKISCSDIMLKLSNTPFYWWSIYNQLYELKTRLIASYSGLKISGLSDERKHMIKGKSSGANTRTVLCDIAYSLNKFISTARNDDTVTFNSIPDQVTATIMTADRRILGQALATKIDVITKAVVPFYGNTVFEYNDEGFYKDNIKSISLPRGAANYVLSFNDTPFWVVWDKTTLPSGVNCKNRWYEDNALVFSTTSSASTSSFSVIYNKYDLQPLSQSELSPPDASLFTENEKSYDKIKVGAFVSTENYTKNANSHIVSTTGDETEITRDSVIQKYISNSRRTVKAKIVMQDECVGDLIKIETAYDGVIQGIITSMDVSMGFDNVAEIEVLEWR